MRHGSYPVLMLIALVGCVPSTTEPAPQLQPTRSPVRPMDVPLRARPPILRIQLRAVDETAVGEQRSLAD